MYFILNISIKLTIGFLALVLFMNINGKSQLTPMSVGDQIGNYVLGGIIGGTIYSDNISITQFLMVLLVWGSLMTLIDYLKNKNTIIRKAFDGELIYLVKNSVIIPENFAKANLSLDDFYTKLRLREISNVSDIKEAFVERNGQLIILKKNDDRFATLVISNGKILKENLEDIHKNTEWLMEKLEDQNITDIEDIFLAEWNNTRLFVVKKQIDTSL